MQVQRIEKCRRAAITLAIVLITLVITYLPAIIIALVTASSDSILVKPRFIAITWSWVGIPMMLGSLCNPIIYCSRMKKLRHAFLEILHLRKPENTVPEAEITGTQPIQPGPTFCRTDHAGFPVTRKRATSFDVISSAASRMPPSHRKSQRGIALNSMSSCCSHPSISSEYVNYKEQ